MKTTTKNFEGVGRDAAETLIKAGTEAATKGYEKAVTMTKEQVDVAVKNYGEATEFGKGTFEAYIAAGNVAAKHVEAFNAEILAFAKTRMEEGVQAARALMGAKTLKDAIDLQTGFAKTAFDAVVAENAKLSEMALKGATEAAEPLQARFTVAVEKFVKPMAA